MKVSGHEPVLAPLPSGFHFSSTRHHNNSFVALLQDAAEPLVRPEHRVPGRRGWTSATTATPDSDQAFAEAARVIYLHDRLVSDARGEFLDLVGPVPSSEVNDGGSHLYRPSVALFG